MASTDFSRTVSTPSQHHTFDRSGAFFARLHIDLILLLLLIALGATGLAVLYSGSGQEIGMVKRQAVHFGIGMILLFFTAQICQNVFESWIVVLLLNSNN